MSLLKQELLVTPQPYNCGDRNRQLNISASSGSHLPIFKHIFLPAAYIFRPFLPLFVNVVSPSLCKRRFSLLSLNRSSPWKVWFGWRLIRRIFELKIHRVITCNSIILAKHCWKLRFWRTISITLGHLSIVLDEQRIQLFRLLADQCME